MFTSAHLKIGKFGRDQGARKINRRHTGDIPRIQFFAQQRYLSAFGGSGKLAIYGRALTNHRFVV
jgi:hypothetical protein